MNPFQLHWCKLGQQHVSWEDKSKAKPHSGNTLLLSLLLTFLWFTFCYCPLLCWWHETVSAADSSSTGFLQGGRGGALPEPYKVTSTYWSYWGMFLRVLRSILSTRDRHEGVWRHKHDQFRGGQWWPGERNGCVRLWKKISEHLCDLKEWNGNQWFWFWLYIYFVCVNFGLCSLIDHTQHTIRCLTLCAGGESRAVTMPEMW